MLEQTHAALKQAIRERDEARAAHKITEERRHVLQEALQDYGDHWHTCPAYDTGHMNAEYRKAHPCDCGLDALLSPPATQET